MHKNMKRNNRIKGFIFKRCLSCTTQNQLFMSQSGNYAIYTTSGKLLKLFTNINSLDISDLTSGIYFIRNQEGIFHKFQKM